MRPLVRAIHAVLVVVAAAVPGFASAQPQEPIEWVEGPSAYDDLQITPDGRFLAWTTVERPAGATTDIVLHDRRGDRTSSLTLPMRTTGPVIARVHGLTSDGTRALVWTPDGLLFDGDPIRCTAPAEDCNFSADVYVVAVAGGEVTRVSLTPAGDEVARSNIAGAVMSEDGTRIAMVGDGLVVPDDNPLHDLYVRDLRATPPTTVRVTWALAGAEPDAQIEDGIAISPDGNVVAFVSAASNLVPDDTNGTWDVFVAEVDSGRIERVSVRDDGSEVSEPSGHREGWFPYWPQVSLSHDGRFVAFTSFANDLEGTDVAEGTDVYLHDRRTHVTRLVSSQPMCPTRGGGSFSPSLSWNGELIAFVTRDECLSPMPLETQAMVMDLVTGAAVAVSIPTDGSSPDGPTNRVLLAGLGDRVLFSSEARNLTSPGPTSGIHHAFTTNAFRDRDGDGLYDDWEDFGIDVGGDGVVDLSLSALGARSDHRDLFVEIDWLFGADHTHLPSALALSQVEDAFRAAPVSNPDGTTGIRIHFLWSDPIEERPSNVELEDLLGVRAIKGEMFGDAAHRAPSAANQLAARRLVFRYLLIGHLRSGTTSSGVSEYPGDDFLVSLGAFEDGVGTVDQQAATIMHELGHALGLGHGGIDDVNCKPNYLSLMSYAFQFPDLVPDRPLDYGRALASIEERHLSEMLGIGGPAGRTTVYGVAGGSGTHLIVTTAADAPIDWNGDGDDTDVDVDVDINDLGFGGCGESLDFDPFVSSDDWGRIVYDLRRTRGYGDGAGARTSADEITSEILDAMRATRPGPRNLPPIAIVGPAVTVEEEGSVVLDGTGSRDPEGATISYAWRQTSGPAGALSASDVVMPTFTAPRVDEDVTTWIELSVHDGAAFGAPRFQQVTVRDLGGPRADAGNQGDAGSRLDDASVDSGPSATPMSGCGCHTTTRSSDARWVSVALFGVLAVTRRRRARIRSTA